MGVSVVVVTFNSKDVVGRCLKSLAAQTAPPDEVVVVDNASEDNTADMIAQDFPAAKLIRNEKNVGFAEACNIGIRNTSGDFVALLNPDAWADAGWLEELAATIKSCDSIAIVGSKILSPDGTIWSAGGRLSFFRPGMAFLVGSRQLDNGTYDTRTGRDFVDTCACLIRRRALDEVGGFDPKLYLAADDLDWCWRAKGVGCGVVYEPKAIAWHAAGHSLGRGADYFYWNVRGQLYFIDKHFRGVKKLILAANYKIYLAYLRRKFRSAPLMLDAIERAVREAKK